MSRSSRWMMCSLVVLGAAGHSWTAHATPSGAVSPTVPALTSSVSAHPVPTPPEPTPASLAAGRALFGEHCAHCHGDRGDGAGPTGQFLTPRPRNYAADPFKAGDAVAQIFGTLKSGLPATAMVSFASLPEDARWSLAWYVAHWRPTTEGRRAGAIVAALPATTPTPGR